MSCASPCVDGNGQHVLSLGPETLGWHKRLARLAILLFVGLASIWCIADAELQQAESRRFQFRADNPSQLVSLARWAGEVADRVEAACGLRMQFDDSRVYEITIRPAVDSSPGRVARLQERKKGVLVQRLTIENFESVSWQDALEAHTSLLLSGYVAARQDADDTDLPEVPGWLAFGLAHYVDSRLRRHSSTLLVSWQETGVHEKLSDILKWKSLPRSATEKKRACCAAVSWLLSSPSSAVRMDKVFSRLAEGEAVTAEWLATMFLGMNSVGAMEETWGQWTARYRLPKSDLGVLSSDTLKRLQAHLVVRSGTDGVPANWHPPRMLLGDLIPLKKSAWVPQFCELRKMQLEFLGAGKPAEFAELVKSYQSYLDALRRRKWDRALKRLILRANSGHERLQAIISAREQYVDDVERRYTGVGSPSGGGVDDRLARSPFQVYVDEVEKRSNDQSVNTNAATSQEAGDDNQEEQEEKDGSRQD